MQRRWDHFFQVVTGFEVVADNCRYSIFNQREKKAQVWGSFKQ